VTTAGFYTTAHQFRYDGTRRPRDVIRWRSRSASCRRFAREDADMSLRHALVVGVVIAVAAGGGAGRSAADPHDDEPEVFTVKGTLTKIDLVMPAPVIAVDTIDRATKAPRNLLLFVDKKVKIRSGRAKLQLSELQPG
jgi:hypothetical protein